MATTKVIDEAARKAIYKVFIRGTAQQVFHELTKTDEIQKAIFYCRMHAENFEPGTTMSMRSPDGKYVSMIGKILEYTPYTRFAHTLKFTSYDDPECTVIYDITEQDGGVELTLTCENLPMGTKTAKNMASGGTLICNNIKAIVETGKPTFVHRTLFMALIKIAGVFSPKKCRTENWI